MGHVNVQKIMLSLMNSQYAVIIHANLVPIIYSVRNVLIITFQSVVQMYKQMEHAIVLMDILIIKHKTKIAKKNALKVILAYKKQKIAS